MSSASSAENNSGLAMSSAQEVSIGNSIEPISRLVGTIVRLGDLIVDIVGVSEAPGRPNSRFRVILHNSISKLSSHFMLSADGALLNSADAPLHAEVEYDTVRGFIPKRSDITLLSPSLVNVGPVFENVDEYSKQFLDEQLDLVVHSAIVATELDTTRLFLFLKSETLDEPEIIVNGIYAYIDSIPEVLNANEINFSLAFNLFHGAVKLLVQAADTLNQSYQSEAIAVLKEASMLAFELRNQIIEMARETVDSIYADEVKMWLTRYILCLRYAQARIEDHHVLRNSGRLEPQKMVSSMSNPWRSSYIGEDELVWEGCIFEPMRPEAIEFVSVTQAMEIVGLDKVVEGLQRKSKKLLSPVDALADMIGFVPNKFVADLSFHSMLVKPSQSFLGLTLNGQPILRDNKEKSLVNVSFKNEQMKLYFALPNGRKQHEVRVLLFFPNTLEESELIIGFDPVLIAKDPESKKVKMLAKLIPAYQAHK